MLLWESRDEYEKLKKEVNTLTEIIKQHNEKFRMIDINDILFDYDLYIQRATIGVFGEYPIYSWFGIMDYINDEPIQLFNSLDDFEKRFEWYKDGIEDGDIIVECGSKYKLPQTEWIYVCQHWTDDIKKKKSKKVLNSKKK